MNTKIISILVIFLMISCLGCLENKEEIEWEEQLKEHQEWKEKVKEDYNKLEEEWILREDKEVELLFRDAIDKYNEGEQVITFKYNENYFIINDVKYWRPFLNLTIIPEGYENRIVQSNIKIRYVYDPKIIIGDNIIEENKELTGELFIEGSKLCDVHGCLGNYKFLEEYNLRFYSCYPKYWERIFVLKDYHFDIYTNDNCSQDVVYHGNTFPNVSVYPNRGSMYNSTINSNGLVIELCFDEDGINILCDNQTFD